MNMIETVVTKTTRVGSGLLSKYVNKQLGYSVPDLHVCTHSTQF